MALVLHKTTIGAISGIQFRKCHQTKEKYIFSDYPVSDCCSGDLFYQ
uniref:Uncharacterized protein n=1 Tax=Anguilla anguilla TaxID=7936 RepID=A0A0E9TEM3_ANGAN